LAVAERGPFLAASVIKAASSRPARARTSQDLHVAEEV